MAPCRDNKMQKHITLTSRETRVKREQTFSAAKGSLSKFGTYRTTVAPDDPRGLVAMYCAGRGRKAPKVTMPKMPWDDK